MMLRNLFLCVLLALPSVVFAERDQQPVAVIYEGYREVWLPVAEHQLARAGARAAATLNAIFENGASPFDSAPIPFPREPRESSER